MDKGGKKIRRLRRTDLVPPPSFLSDFSYLQEAARIPDSLTLEIPPRLNCIEMGVPTENRHALGQII